MKRKRILSAVLMCAVGVGICGLYCGLMPRRYTCLLYTSVPAIAAALFCAVCLDWAPSPMVSLLLLAVFLLLAGIFIYRNKAFALFGMLAAAHLAFCGFSIYNLYIVEPIRHLNGQSLDIQAVLLEDPDVYEAVSYTHLDVYKRQLRRGSGVPGLCSIRLYKCSYYSCRWRIYGQIGKEVTKNENTGGSCT